MARYKCIDCQTPELPDVPALCERIGGARWWMQASEETAALAVAGCLRSGLCGRHASLVADLVRMVVRQEISRREVLPGTVRVRHVRIDAEPFELLPAGVARKNGMPIVERVQKFVEGSVLSAIVDIDVGSRRGRVTLQLGDDTTVLESDRLVHLTATELATALRSRRGCGDG